MIKSGSRELNRSAAKFLSAVSLSVLAVGTAHAQSAAAQDAAAEEAPADAGDAIVVTGFRASLEAALNLKRDSVAAVDAIVAEDIA